MHQHGKECIVCALCVRWFMPTPPENRDCFIVVVDVGGGLADRCALPRIPPFISSCSIMWVGWNKCIEVFASSSSSSWSTYNCWLVLLMSFCRVINSALFIRSFVRSLPKWSESKRWVTITPRTITALAVAHEFHHHSFVCWRTGLKSEAHMINTFLTPNCFCTR